MRKLEFDHEKIILEKNYNPIYESSFTQNILKLFEKDILKLLVPGKVEKKKFNRVIINSLFNLNGPKALYDDLFESFNNPVLDFKFSFFWRWCALKDAYCALMHSEAFLKRYPSGRSFIEKNEYIKYHLEVFFQNLYNLRERLKKFYEATYKNTSIFQGDINIQIKNGVLKFFQEWIERYRNPLVHDFYSYNDKELDQLRGLELHQHITPNESFKEMIQDELLFIASSVKKQKSEIISKILISVKQLLFYYFNEFESFFFEQDKTLIVPFEI